MKYPCDLCNRNFCMKGTLLRHKIIAHAPDRAFVCEVCGQVYEDNWKLLIHMENHKRRFKCDICNTLWSTTYNLRTHMLSHTGEKPHKCEVCEQAFSRIDNLKLHLKLMHKEVPRYQCKKCNKKFKTNKEKVDHGKQEHPPKKKKIECKICGWNLAKKGLARHARLHRQDKILKCEQCEKPVILTQKRYKYDIPNKDNRIITVCHGCFEDFARTFEPEKYESLRVLYVFKHKCQYCKKAFSFRNLVSLAPHEASCWKKTKTSGKNKERTKAPDTVIMDKDLTLPISDGEQSRSDRQIPQSSCSEIVPENNM